MAALQDAMENWPPTIGVGPTGSPITQSTDVIRRATVVEQEGIHVLSLSIEGKRAASEPISDGSTDVVRRIAPSLEGLTIDEAGRMPLDANE